MKSMKTYTITAKPLVLPCVMNFRDYHHIPAKESDLREIYGNKIKLREIDYDGRYWGVCYTGIKPTKQEIRTMLVKAGFDDIYRL